MAPHQQTEIPFQEADTSEEINLQATQGSNLHAPQKTTLFSTNDRWLLALCTPSTTPMFSLETFLQQFGAPDLAELYERSKDERLTPLFARQLERCELWPAPLQQQVHQLPSTLREEARQRLRNQRKQALLQEHMLSQLAQVLQSLQTTAIMYKGIAYERCLYPQVGLRPMVDIDLILPTEHYDRFCADLLKQGTFQSFLHHTHEHSFQHQPTKLLIDIHQALSPHKEGGFHTKALFSLSRPIEPQSPYHVLPAHIMLLMHLLHIRGNGMNPLETTLQALLDLLLLVEKADRAALLEQAKKWRMMGLLRFADVLLSQLSLSPPIRLSAPPRLPWEHLQEEGILRLLERIERTKQDPHATTHHFQRQEDKILRTCFRALCYDTPQDLAQSQGKHLLQYLFRKLFPHRKEAH
ncbi:MAG: nucleotidyltransferase family protein [Myxococcales bacterium]|nr:nucleotidyltransferase family protein [Myxococcales bacterium]